MDFALVDAVLEETGTRERRLRLSSRVVVDFVLALALCEDHPCRGVRGKPASGPERLPLAHPATSSLSRARRRTGVTPLRRLLHIPAGPVARPDQAGAFHRGLRTAAVDGTPLHVPDDEAVTSRHPKRASRSPEFGPRSAVAARPVKSGTDAVPTAAPGPDSDNELPMPEPC
ncbi:hypothetical protein GXW82_10940 [Streptacidiphilus sp. 4-A2]|nr:hypothetical protein [Streptacidiphilus sp. 4-A2]